MIVLFLLLSWQFFTNSFVQNQMEDPRGSNPPYGKIELEALTPHWYVLFSSAFPRFDAWFDCSCRLYFTPSYAATFLTTHSHNKSVFFRLFSVYIKNSTCTRPQRLILLLFSDFARLFCGISWFIQKMEFDHWIGRMTPLQVWLRCFFFCIVQFFTIEFISRFPTKVLDVHKISDAFCSNVFGRIMCWRKIDDPLGAIRTSSATLPFGVIIKRHVWANDAQWLNDFISQ